ncbi:hypothetical protein CPHO_11950 [Corynebacterium phocae]|uniref:TIGR02206 family membrane protein n=1 Tax=Corynebacterium phocae TaxID=161895 RepID=A0A1L7D5R5_9CORY|nr:TIGR02206 family membrane protein [Corynebacterium phocae]APT93484.1 hypothetical protein CPHO_11950 [Corynebacterium phocae]KAA8720564.1 TIGR02206 family membrane protein [Corynebacterium phocae]
MNILHKPEYTAQFADYARLRPFTAPHWAMLATTAGTCAGFIAVARAVRGTPQEEKLRRGWGYAHLAAGTAWTIASLDPRQLDLKESLPLHLCDVLRPIMALGLVTGNPHALNITYYWGILLNPQAIITPDVIYYYEPRAVRFATYWFFHITALATPLALTFGLGYRPTWRGYRAAAALSPLWLALAGSVNILTGGNYGFLRYPPKSGSLMDKFGPWPYYVAVECAVAGVCWAAMTAPWETKRGRRGTLLLGRGFLRKAIR